jgi:hypothetical protein
MKDRMFVKLVQPIVLTEARLAATIGFHYVGRSMVRCLS